MTHRRAFTIALLVLSGGAAAPLRAQSTPPIAPDSYKQLKFRYIGPVGNRVIAIAGVPGNPNIYYAGAASGGIFKTTDNGAHWDAIFDDQPVSSIGSLAIAPSDPNVVFAGTGESFIRSNISIGNGIYKSTDAGKTWTHAGLDKTGRIGRVLIDPTNPDIVIACALGHAYGPQAERGVFRTTDGGKNWVRTLFVDEGAGCSDVGMDSTNPRILFAGMWQLEIHTWGRKSGGLSGGLFKSTDGGVTWKRLVGHGLPKSPVGKVSAQVARSNPNRVYALIETGDGMPTNNGQLTQSGSLWRSDDGGENWELVSSDRKLRGRTHYYTRFAIQPDNENEAWFLSAEFSKTIDGGKTTIDLIGKRAAAGDDHDMWIDPTNGDRLAVAHDDGYELLGESGPKLAPDPAAGGPDVSRGHRRSDSLQRLRQPAGRSLDPWPQPQPDRQAGGRRGGRSDSPRLLALGGGRRKRLGDSRPRRQQHRLGHRHGLRQPRRDGRAVRRADASGARGRDLAGSHDRHVGGRPEVPVQLDASRSPSRPTITTPSMRAASTYTAPRTAARAGRRSAPT